VNYLRSALPALLERLYAAVTAPEQWPEFLELLCRSFGAHSSGLSMASGTGVVQRWAGLDPEFERSYLDHYWRFDPWVEPGLRRPVGQCLIGSELVTDADLERSAFYSDLGRQHGMHRLLSVVLRRNDRGAVWCSLIRDKASSDFKPSDRRALSLLAPHLQRACDVAGRLGFSKSVVAAFDQLPLPTVIVDASCNVVRSSPGAQALLAQRDGLVTGTGSLAAELREDSERLRSAIKCAARNQTAPEWIGGPIIVRRPRSGQRALLVHVLPCAPVGSALFERTGTALVFVVDPDAIRQAAEDEIERVFELTPAEARLAAVLAGGATIERAADELGVSYHTARTQLRDIFSKTGVHRQSELVRLIGNLAIGRPPGGEGPGA
jgi:DNA-binding CsgD family transcriptional regulator